ncbi:hypothetical protein [Roseibium algae]|uniref:Uncharacterized protein n=1 Tax=Roseibium algae TaxID=3123038 RepID=A0ABU8TF01_9HYPH
MAAIGNNYAKRNERPKRSEINKAWAAKRSKAVQQGQQLRSTVSNTVFSTTVNASAQAVNNALKGSYSSNAAALSRLNILV